MWYEYSKNACFDLFWLITGQENMLVHSHWIVHITMKSKCYWLVQLPGSRRIQVHVTVVASRNPWLRLETKAWWTETGFRDSRPTKSRLETTWSRLETGLETPEIATRKQHTRDQNVILRDLPVATRDRVFSSRDHPCLDWAAHVLLGHDLLGYLLTGLHVFLLLFVCENVRAGPITQLFECMHD